MLAKIDEKDIKVIATRATMKIWKQISESAQLGERFMTGEQRIYLKTEIEQIIIEAIQNDRSDGGVF